jgi:hypothetical protein
MRFHNTFAGERLSALALVTFIRNILVPQNGAE